VLLSGYNCDVMNLLHDDNYLRTVPVIVCIIVITGGQSNLTKRPHRRRTWTVQSYLPGGANVFPCLTRASLDLPKFIPQMVC